MGFYGSVYYQLIDTFYKVIGKNSGKSSKALPTSYPQTELEAIGRKGIINLDTGNKWINISKNGDAIILSHSGADSKSNCSSIIPFSVVNGSGSGSGESSSNPKKLNYSDIIKIETIFKDAAGHTSVDGEALYFQLPEAPKITDDVKSLQTFTGVSNTIPSNSKLYSSTSTTPKTNLYNYAIHNYGCIKKQKEILGDWDSITANNKKPTVVSTIGAIDNLFAADSWIKGIDPGTSNYPSLVSCIGNMSDIALNFNKKSVYEKCSISEAFVEIANELKTINSNILMNDQNIGTTQTAVDALKTLVENVQETVGSRGSNGVVYKEIEEIKANYKLEDENIKKDYTTKLSELSTYSDNTFETKENAKKYAIATEVANIYLTKEDAIKTYVVPSALNNYALKTTLDDYVKTSALDDYALKTTLDNYVKTSTLNDYVKTSALSDYALTSTLNDYVLGADLDDQIDSIIQEKSPTKENPEEAGQVSINSLQDLLNKIVGLETEITILKEEIKTLKNPTENIE